MILALDPYSVRTIPWDAVLERVFWVRYPVVFDTLAYILLDSIICTVLFLINVYFIVTTSNPTMTKATIGTTDIVVIILIVAMPSERHQATMRQAVFIYGYVSISLKSLHVCV